MDGYDERPWTSVPAHAAEVLRPGLPALADEIVRAVGEQIPDYRRPLEGPFGRALRAGVEQALDRFVDLLRGEPEDPESRRFYVDLGRGEARAGRTLEAVLAAYRLGARLAWRRIVEAGTRAQLDAEVLYQLGEAIFAYIDGLSAETAEGHARERLAAASERQRERDELVALLLDPRAPDAAIADAAALVHWQPPAHVAALVTEEQEPLRLAGRLGGDVIAATRDGVTLALIPDPGAPLRRRELASRMGRRRGALGPGVPLRELERSYRRARVALTLLPRSDDQLLVAGEHLPQLLLHCDRELASELALAALEPLSSLDDRSAQRLRATLRAWLDHRGRVGETAAALGVHAQTVRYRLAQLRELFGERLEQPDGRFELLLALRAAAEA